MNIRILAVGFLAMAHSVFSAMLFAQSAQSPNEVRIERCDRLPIVKVYVGATEMRFLVDTGATSILNIKSFAGGNAKGIQITSWSGTTFTNARQVSIPDLAIGDHHLRNLRRWRRGCSTGYRHYSPTVVHMGSPSVAILKMYTPNASAERVARLQSSVRRQRPNAP